VTWWVLVTFYGAVLGTPAPPHLDALYTTEIACQKQIEAQRANGNRERMLCVALREPKS
jgi:hypothetical protein